MAVTGKLLYLYSSNIRPLYVQDILDVLAAPHGTVYRFRYEKIYLNQEALRAWGSDELRGTGVLVHFSLQQEARYHEPILFPVRRGEVVTSSVEGSAYIVEFSVGSIVSLPAWPQKTDEANRQRPGYEEPPEAYKTYLLSLGVDIPYRFPAGLGPDLTSRAQNALDISSDEEILFERNTHYLSKTDSFRSATFVRFLRLTTQGGETDVAFDEETRSFRLDGGRTYSAQVTQRQPRDVIAPQRFAVEADEEIVTVVGDRRFEIASRYDRVPIALHAIDPPSSEARETLVVIRPLDPQVQGPTIRIPLKVQPSVGRAVEGVATTLGLVLVAVLTPLQDEIGWVTGLLVAGVLASQVALRWTPLVRWLKRLLSR